MACLSNFTRDNKQVVLYQVQDNLEYKPASDWSGTISYYLSLDPDKDLAPSYVDPIQITSRAWNDAAIWNDFTLDSPRQFRLGVLADLKVWNPDNKDFEKMPLVEKPAVQVRKPPFATGRWTHVAITFAHFNTDRPNGEARLYLDGELQGAVQDRNLKYTWEPGKAVIFLGIGYVGLIDDVLLFNRSLTATEIQTITELGRERRPLLTP